MRFGIAWATITNEKSPLKPGGMNRGPNIFDFLELRDIPYHVSDPARKESENLAAVTAAIKARKPSSAGTVRL